MNSFINYLNLNQVNNVKNSHGSILDLIFSSTNIDSIFSNYYLIPLINSYRLPLEFIYSLVISEILDEPSSSELFNYNFCNYMEIVIFLENIDILSNIINLDLKNAILKFYEILNHTCDLCVPKTKLNLKFNYSLPWSNYSLRNLIKEKFHSNYILKI